MVHQTRLNNTRKHFWLDATLLLSFVLSLVPQITGMWAHQWLGIGMSVGVLVHLAWHGPWIRAMLRCYLKPLPRRSRANVLVDTLLGITSALLLVTGVLMSPTFMPYPIRWAKAVHSVIWTPFAGLMALHLALHWKWIAKSARRWILGPRPGYESQRVPATVGPRAGAAKGGQLLSRRRFLVLGGGATAAFLFGLARVASPASGSGSGSAPQAASRCPFGLTNDPYPGRCGRYTDTSGNGLCDFSEQGADSEVALSMAVPATQALVASSQQATPEVRAPTATALAPSVPISAPQTPVASSPQATPEVRAPADTATPATTGAVACPFGLVNDPHPGRCRRYTDRNGNGYCDLSEPGSGSRI